MKAVAAGTSPADEHEHRGGRNYIPLWLEPVQTLHGGRPTNRGNDKGGLRGQNARGHFPVRLLEVVGFRRPAEKARLVSTWEGLDMGSPVVGDDDGAGYGVRGDSLAPHQGRASKESRLAAMALSGKPGHRIRRASVASTPVTSARSLSSANSPRASQASRANKAGVAGSVVTTQVAVGSGEIPPKGPE
jgi:hypothetical protein